MSGEKAERIMERLMTHGNELGITTISAARRFTVCGVRTLTSSTLGRWQCKADDDAL